jgi:hypothetical protein
MNLIRQANRLEEGLKIGFPPLFIGFDPCGIRENIDFTGP